MRILAVDPGPTRSAWVLLADDGRVMEHEHEHNANVRGVIDNYANLRDVAVAIEMIASYGMPVGAEVFQTCVEIGRFVQMCEYAERVHFVKRIEVKSHLCHSGKAKDSNIRQAIIDRYGGKDRAIGLKKTPGPLYGVKADVWAALAVALVVQDRLAARAA